MSECAVKMPLLTCSQSRAVLVGLGLGLVLVIALPILARNARGIGSAAGGAAVDFAGGFVSESVQTAGEIVGIPRTNQTQCQADLAAGRTWDASFSCSAADFLKGLFR